MMKITKEYKMMMLKNKLKVWERKRVKKEKKV
jgi:hypothetical protein